MLRFLKGHVPPYGLVRDLLDRIFAVKEGRRFLQRPVLGLHDKEPQKEPLAHKPAHVHQLSSRRHVSQPRRRKTG